MKIAKLTKSTCLENLEMDNENTPLDPGEGVRTLKRMGFTRFSSGHNVLGNSVEVWIRPGSTAHEGY